MKITYRLDWKVTPVSNQDDKFWQLLYCGRFNRPTYSSSTIYVGILKSIIFQKESCKEMMESFKVIFVSIQSLTLSIRFIRVEESFNRRQQDTAPAWDELISIFLKSQTKI